MLTDVTVSHDDVQDVPSYFAASNVAKAVEYVMEQRRDWSLGTLVPTARTVLRSLTVAPHPHKAKRVCALVC